MVLPIYGIVGGITALFFGALFLRAQNMLEPKRVLISRRKSINLKNLT
jgi:hypothetical protein